MFLDNLHHILTGNTRKLSNISEKGDETFKQTMIIPEYWLTLYFRTTLFLSRAKYRSKAPKPSQFWYPVTTASLKNNVGFTQRIASNDWLNHHVIGPTQSCFDQLDPPKICMLAYICIAWNWLNKCVESSVQCYLRWVNSIFNRIFQLTDAGMLMLISLGLANWK